MGARGRARGEFLNPQGVAVTLKGDLLVTDSNNQNVQMFTRSVITVMMMMMIMMMMMMIMMMMMTMMTMMMMMMMMMIMMMMMFLSSGVFIQRWGTRGRFPGQLQRPTGITINKVRFI